MKSYMRNVLQVYQSCLNPVHAWQEVDILCTRKWQGLRFSCASRSTKLSSGIRRRTSTPGKTQFSIMACSRINTGMFMNWPRPTEVTAKGSCTVSLHFRQGVSPRWDHYSALLSLVVAVAGASIQAAGLSHLANLGLSCLETVPLAPCLPFYLLLSYLHAVSGLRCNISSEVCV